MADVLPQSPPSNGDESLRWVILGVGVIWNCTWSLAFTALRIFVRTRVANIKLWWDDYFIICAAFSELVGTVLVIVEVHLGFGRHQYYLTSSEIILYLKLTYVEWIQTFFTLMCTKVSIAFFLLRIPIQKIHIWPLRASIAALIVSNLVLTMLWIFQCWPVEAVWDPTVKAQHCFDHGFVSNVILAQGIIAAISDFGFALFPILLISHLKMRLKDKVGLCVLMGLGLITGACCVIRMTWNWQAVPQDLTYGGMTNYVWRNIEIGLGIALASVPPLVPGYKWFKRRVKHGWSSTFGTASTGDSLPFAPTPIMPHKRRAGDSTELLRTTTNQNPIRTSISGGPAATSDSIDREKEERRLPVTERDLETGGQPAIWKITQIDVEYENRHRQTSREKVEDLEKGGRPRPGPRPESGYHHGAARNGGVAVPPERPSLEVDLRPSFEENREVFEDILEGEAVVRGRSI